MKSSSMVSDKKLTNAVGGKSARACDNCIKRRARWYCAADDAFLCQSCDSSVHSANPLARRHERVRLKTTSISSFNDLQIAVPSWHQGFTRKARTPRQKRHGKFPRVNLSCLDLVPEIGSELEYSHEESDEQLLYRVPIFDPFVAELCNSANSNHQAVEKDFLGAENGPNFGDEPKGTSFGFAQETTNHLQGFLPSEMDLAEFAADVENLLGKGLEDESFDMEGLGILDCDYKGKDCAISFRKNERVKVEEEDAGEVTVCHEICRNDVEIDLGRESFELNFDYDSPIPCEGEDCKQVAAGDPIVRNNFELHKFGQDPRKTLLCLDYESVLSSWDNNKSPWTTRERPDLNSGDFWVTKLSTNGGMPLYGDMGMMNSGGATAVMADGDREARVSRYREKRRTRLFAKKIRYEVRKLNAEKRPRMKGRFVKRASLASSPATTALSFPLLINNNNNSNNK